MEWLALLTPLLEKLFENCENRSNAQRASFVKERPNIARSRLRRALRKGGHKGSDLRKKLNSAMEEIADSECCDIEEFLDELEDN